MNSVVKLAIAAAPFTLMASAAQASSVVDLAHCSNVASSSGCLFDGNINGNTVLNGNSYLDAQNAYNAFNDIPANASANPDITLNFLADSTTGQNTTSGSWSMPGYLVDFIAVKASNQFVLYQITPASSGTWNTYDIPNNRNPHGLSHIVFFGTKDNTTFGGVPEPATWLTMILGFAAVGWAMRRRKGEESRVRFAF